MHNVSGPIHPRCPAAASASHPPALPAHFHTPQPLTHCATLPLAPLQGLRVCNMLEGGVTPLHTPAELQAMGFHLVVHPLSGLYAATRSLLNVYGTLLSEGTTRGKMDDLAHFEVGGWPGCLEKGKEYV